ncbi:MULTISPECIES: hypothetical protein [Gluconobacter]|uniref:Lipoprotein n=1 Tax=Gluconobacter cerinus TaxID=38307 RepID=A0AAV5NGC8_9PROT|nr:MULTISPECIES: hypothetical protein [Gluconobacter]GBR00103.1 hypothetical protein AA0229_1214 [Gluconobacter cerinus NRIC 0229]GLQ63430.1 hypothetical protein GCM10007867_22750 [Gluconobacter cerinus]
MLKLSSPLSVPAALFLAAFSLAGCVSEPLSPQEQQLASAGFVRHPANSPSRRAELQLMPQHVFLTRTTPEGLRYIYADRDICDCAYIGTQEAFEKYAAQQPHGVPTLGNATPPTANPPAPNLPATGK